MFSVAKQGKSTRNQFNFSVSEALSILVDAMLQKTNDNLSNLMREFLQSEVDKVFDKKTQRAILDGEIVKRKAAGIPYDQLLPKEDTKRQGEKQGASG